MTHPIYLAKYAALLSQGDTLNRGKKSEFAFQGLYLKHDNLDFFHWSLEQLAHEKWRITELSFDLHESELPDDYKIMTTYETRWTGEGMKTNFMKATVQ